MNIVAMDNNQRIPNYLSLFGLSESAFSQQINDKFYFLDTEQAQNLNLLHNLIQDQNLFLHISGESGVGKSCLINRFINLGEEDWRFSYFSANAMMNSEQLIFNILSSFGLNGLAKPNADLKDTCIKNIAVLEKSGVIPILVIDDVQELPLETLRTIFELVNRWDKNHPKLRIILVSNPQFSKILESEEIKPLRQFISHNLEINPLTEEQIEEYIYFRLTVAGLDGRNPINPEACYIISEKSEGIPRAINSLCHLALRDGMEEMSMKEFFDDHNFNFPFRKYLITGALMSIFLGVLFSVIEPFDWSNYKDKLITKIQKGNDPGKRTAISNTSVFAYLTDQNIKAIHENSDELTKVKLKNKVVSKVIEQYDFSQFTFLSELQHKNIDTIISLVKLQYKNIKEKKIATVKIKPTKSTNVSLKQKTPILKSAESKQNEVENYNVAKLTTIKSKNFPEIISIVPTKLKANIKRTEKIISLFGVWFGDKSKISIYGTDGVVELTEDNITYISDTQINIKIEYHKYTGKHWVVITDPENGKSNSKLLVLNSASTSELNRVDRKLVEGEKWILAQQSDLFILHVLGSMNKDEINSFINNENMNGQYAVFETNRRGVDWYHLILGTYKTRDEARFVVKNLPQRIKQPWIRSIKDIQKVIKNSSIKTVSIR